MIAPLPDLTKPVTATITAGEGGTLVGYNRSLSREGVANTIVVRGDNGSGSTTPVQAIAEDVDPLSPTCVQAFGRVVETNEFAGVTTVPQCQAIANALLSDRKGLSASLDLTAVPNPALRPGDILLATFADGTSETHVIDSLSVPLSGGDFQVTTRAITIN